MKKILLLAIFLSVMGFSPPKKIVYPYVIAISDSELIVDGIVSNVSAEEYEFEINEFVKGKSSQRVNVKIWEEWLCDARVADIKKGQRLLLFLKKLDNQDNSYRPFNDSTGELLVSKNDSVKTFMMNSFPLIGEVKDGIKIFRDAYFFMGDPKERSNSNKYFKKLISQKEIDQKKKANKFFRFLLDEELIFYKVK